MATDPATVDTSAKEFPHHFNFATDVVDKWARESPNLPAMFWSPGNDRGAPLQELSYAHFSARSKQAAHILRNLGAKQGDRMIILLSRIPAWWEICTAAIRMGVVLCPCTTLAVAKDIEMRARESGASIFVGNDQSIRSFLKVKANCSSIRIVLQAGGAALNESGVVQYQTEMEAVDPEEPFHGPKSAATDPALIYFTSGTTGMPKMVLHSQVSYPLAHKMTGKHWLLLKPGKVYWNLSEQGWAKAAWAWFAAWNMGAALFVKDLSGAFSVTELLETLHRHPITTLCAPPTIYRQLILTDARNHFQQHRPCALEHCVGAGEPLNAEVIKQWYEMSDIVIMDGYGQTETILLCGNFLGQEVRPGSMGRPTPGVPLDIVNEDGQVAAAEEEGDIAVATTLASGQEALFICDGYLSRDGGTSLKLRAEKGADNRQWYLTGDRGYRDEDGYIWFVGRSDDVITSSGYRIGPFEVESVLKQHPAVQESAVIAVPDETRGEIVKAFVVLVQEYKRTKEVQSLAEEIQKFCKEHTAPYKYPRKIEFVDQDFLPRTINGKIRRVGLRQMEAKKSKPTTKL